jgi:hypothetical protein
MGPSLRCRLLAQTGRKRAARACPLCPGISDINLFRYGQGVIDLNAEIPDRAFNLGMPEQKLVIGDVAGDGADAAGPITRTTFCSRKREMANDQLGRRSELISEMGHRRQVADVSVQHPEKGNDGRLVRGEAVEITHSTCLGSVIAAPRRQLLAGPMPPSWAYAPWPVGAALADLVQALAQRIRRDAAV